MPVAARTRLLRLGALGALGVATGTGVLAVALAGAPTAAGAPTCTITWTGATSTDWDTAANWSPARVPTTTDVACMAASPTRSTVVSTQPRTVRAVYFTLTGSRLTVAGGGFTVTEPAGPTGSSVVGLTLSAGTLSGAWTATDLTWTSGSLSAGTLTSTGTSTACNANLDTNSRWTNTGTLSWNTTCGYLGFFNGGRFTNAATGTWTITGDGSNGLIDFGSNNGTTNAVVNAGTTTVTLTTATNTVDSSVPFADTGILTVTAGTLSLTGGGVADTPDTGTWNRTLTGTTVTGTAAWAGGSRTATTVSGSGLTVTGGTSTVGTGTLTGLTLTAGTLTVADTKTLTVANLTWTSGSLSGPGTLTSTGTSTACNANLDTNSRWTNTGTLSWNTTCGYLGFFNGGRFTNTATGTWTITGDGSNGLIDFGSNNGTTNAVVNAGTTTVTLTTASQTLYVAPSFTNTGALTVTRGTVNLPTVTNLAAGTLTGGTWNAPTGTITLPGTVSTNAATVAIGATGQVLAASTGTAAFIPLAGNSGSFTSGRTLSLTSAGLANSGTLAVAGGALVVATLTQSAGTTSVAAGATLNAGTAAVRINGGVLTGAGTVRGAVSGAGTVAPGTNGVGTLTVTGTVNTSAGTTLATTQGASAGTAVAASGAINNGGVKLAITTVGTPAIGTVRTVISSSTSRTGLVASATGTDVPAAGGYWVVGYTPTAVTLTLTAYPAVSVAGGVVVVEGNSGTTPATFTVTLAGPSPAQAVVDYATVAGTAASGVDYAGQTGTLTFLPGETSKTVQVSVVGDTLHENDETFGLVLSNPRNTSLGTATAGATIDDDDAVPAFSVDDAQGATSAAGGGTVTFTVSLNTPSGLDARVQYATVDGTAVAGTDYTATSGTVTIPAGQTSATVDVQLTTVTTYAAPKTFSLVLTTPVEATVTDGSGTGTIVNGNPNGPTVAAVVPSQGAQGTAVTVTINGTGFTAGSTVAVAGTGVVVSAVTVVDPTTITATFTVAAGATVSARSVTVTAAGLSDTCSGCFAVVPRPTVTGIDRPNLAVGTTDVLVTITGGQFQPGADVVLVKGSKKVAAGSTTTNSATSVTAFVSLARTTPVGAWNVQVVNPDGGTGTCTGCVTVWAAPTVTGVSPSSLARGTTTNVTITGTGFVAGAAVSVPGAQLSNVTVVNTTTITATVRVPANATTGSRTVKVVNPASAGSGTGTLVAAVTVT